MRFDDRPADREPHAHAAGLRGEEGAEELIHRVRIDADAGVLHGHHHLFARVLGFRAAAAHGQGDGQRRGDFRMLEAGRVDYVVASFVNGMRLIRTLSLEGKIEPLPSRSLKEDDLYVIFSKERVAPAFVQAFSEALRHSSRPRRSGRSTANTFRPLAGARTRSRPVRCWTGLAKNA